MVIAPDVTAVSPEAPKLRVYVPVGPPIAKPLKVATPVVPVVAVAFDSVAPAGPEAMVAVTWSPLWLTGLPFASCTCTAGCWARATPLCTLLEGWVVSVSFVAAPAVPSAVKVTGLPLIPDPAAVAVSVLVPAVVRSEERRVGEVWSALGVWFRPGTLQL